MSNKYILDGHTVVPCDDLMEWARWFENAGDSRVVAYDEDNNNVRVSTVFLGLDHSFGHGEPLLFETMIFGGEHDGFQDRCTTWEQAEQMHRDACNMAWPEDVDPTPYCHQCGARTPENCKCGPIAENN